MKKVVFKGCCTAIITPFKNGEVDVESFKKMIEFQIENGVDAIAVLGTTGEPPTLTTEEKKELILLAKKQIRGRVKMLVGSGANSTKLAVEQSVFAGNLGADALLVVTPYYNKCTQNGLLEHFKKVADAVKIPIIIYNVPGRTGVNILPETAAKLSEIENICGIKEASGDIAQIMRFCKILSGKMAIYSGDDGLNFPFLTLGAAGVISVTSNVLPREIKNLCEFTFEKNLEKAKNLHEKLMEINKNLFIEVNPIPVKFACAQKGLCLNELRLPLTPLEREHEEILKKVLSEFE